MSIKMELELDEADARFLEDVALRTGTTVDESLHVLLCRAREQQYAEATTNLLAPFPDDAMNGKTHLDYLPPLDIPEGTGLTDGSVNHDYYLYDARKKA